MKIKELITEFKMVYKIHFPNSELKINFNTKSFYHNMWVKLYLTANEKECMHNIRDNDMLNIWFAIESENGEFDSNITEETEIDFNLKMECKDKSYLIKPENQYLCYSRRSLSFRKTVGDVSKILFAFEKFCLQLKATLTDDFKNGNIHNNHYEIVKNKLNLEEN